MVRGDGGDAMLDVITHVINLIINEEQVPDDWNHSTMIKVKVT